MDSIQEQIVKQVVAALSQITVANGAQNTVASVQRLNQEGVDLASVPTILVKEGETTVEFGNSVPPMIRRRMELFLVAVTRQDETTTSLDLRSGGELLNSLMADMDMAVQSNRTWGGLAITTDPTSYMEVDMDAVSPHLARAVRCEIVFEHVRNNPYSQT